jgi:hypothetical protein
VIIIKATRITAGQTRRVREADGLTGELDPAGVASVSLLMIEISDLIEIIGYKASSE